MFTWPDKESFGSSSQQTDPATPRRRSRPRCTFRGLPATRVRAVIARRTRAEYRQSILLAALDRSADTAANRARRALSRRWPEVEVEIVDKAPVQAILGEAKRFGADLVVLGWRGHGAVRRLLMGSVSRGVVRGATCGVLVVRRPLRVHSIVVGHDASSGARRALAFAGRLEPRPDGSVTLVSVVELMRAPSMTAPGAATLAQDVRSKNAKRVQTAKQALSRSAAVLRRRGWRTRALVLHGEPLRDLLGAVTSARAQLLIVGAKGTGVVRHLLLGSVAEGALNQCPVGVVIAR